MEGAGFQFLSPKSSGNAHRGQVGYHHLGGHVPVRCLVENQVQLAQAFRYLALGQLGANAGAHKPVALDRMDHAVLLNSDLADKLVAEAALICKKMLFLCHVEFNGGSRHL